MLERIKKIASHWQLSPTALADKIEVSRPVISHILTGRNRPSLEVVQKIALHFPELNRNWLLTGEGKMLASEVKASESESQVQQDVTPSAIAREITPSSEKNEKIQSAEPVNKDSAPSRTVTKTLKKVLLFYSDNSFEEYNP
ncbi:helix-turn-helix transcriptional regulator [Adhaeribacter soli]|uniref:helix-turn-helix transcriptional regulator n=1 Tax=Adhaeribacter soli TaxID=2607655 RepID=UPI001782151C|nr:helix-turn-helix transcriptional regulator [Adhaeribacter soli]